MQGVQPGEGRVIACLRDARANITGELCKRQVLRLLGFVVEDHRMDFELMMVRWFTCVGIACKSTRPSVTAFPFQLTGLQGRCATVLRGRVAWGWPCA